MSEEVILDESGFRVTNQSVRAKSKVYSLKLVRQVKVADEQLPPMGRLGYDLLVVSFLLFLGQLPVGTVAAATYTKKAETIAVGLCALASLSCFILGLLLRLLSRGGPSLYLGLESGDILVARSRNMKKIQRYADAIRTAMNGASPPEAPES